MGGEVATAQRLPARADVVVVGGGLMGTAAAWRAAARGASVALLERFALGHDRGSSHGSARIVRRAYPDPLYARLTGQAFDLWAELESETGIGGPEALIRTTGGIDHGARRDLAGIASALAEAGVPYERLGRAEAQDRWPGMVFEGDVLYHPQAGTVDAARAVRVMAARAEALGATVLERAPALGVELDGDRGDTALVRTAFGDVRARSVVLAAGAWIEPVAGPVAHQLGVTLPRFTVTQQQIFHFPRGPGTAEWPTVVHKDAFSTYHLPGGRDGAGSGGDGGARKIAEHSSFGSAPTTADTRSGEVDPAARERITAYVRRWLPGLIDIPFAEATCLYTSTANDDFVLDRVGPVVFCSPCSGHGAKFAPLIGELSAELALAPSGSRSQATIERFTLGAHR